MNEQQRQAFVKDELTKRGKWVELPKPTHAQQVCNTAVRIFNDVSNQTLRPLLRALPSASAYDPKGTQQLLVSSFCSKFSTFSKEELVALLSVMHAEELENQAFSMVQAGLIGPDMDKPI